MKKYLVSLTVMIVLIAAVAVGCTRLSEAFTEPDQPIDVGVNQPFTIALGSNASTGYGWQVLFDDQALRLMETTYEERDATGLQVVGAPGTQYFKFASLAEGETKITFTYRCSWGEPVREDQILTFTIRAE